MLFGRGRDSLFFAYSIFFTFHGIKGVRSTLSMCFEFRNNVDEKEGGEMA